jgi:hypothetical protein
MKNTLVFFIITVASISSLLVNTAYAVVICVDKNNPTKILTCSDPNAVDKNTIKTSPTSENKTPTSGSAAPETQMSMFSLQKYNCYFLV